MSNDLTLYEQQWAEQAKELAQHERVSGAASFSIRGGMLSLGEERMPGDQICVIVLDALRVNTFYEGKWESDNPMPPTCFAAGRVEEEMGPHTSMQADLNWFKPQTDPSQPGACRGCPRNQWGSAEQGRGKACQNRRELTLLPAGYYQPRQRSRDFDLQLFDDPGHFQTAQAAKLRLPVTSVNNWAQYVNLIAATHRRPPAGVATRIYLDSHAQAQTRVCFEMVELIPDHLASIIIQRQQQAVATPWQGFAPPQEQSARQPQRSLRR